MVGHVSCDYDIVVHLLIHSQGNISRQETVSMIPPLLLDVKPHHKVRTCMRDSSLNEIVIVAMVL